MYDFAFSHQTVPSDKQEPHTTELILHIDGLTLWLVQAQGHLVELLKKLRCGDASQSTCPSAVALQHIDKLQHLHEDLLQQQQRHLLASELFKEKGVEEAVQVCFGLMANGTQFAEYEQHLAKLSCFCRKDKICTWLM